MSIMAHERIILSHPSEKTKKKTCFSISLPSSKLTISLISIHKHYAIDIADPRSVQDACHMNFVIDLAHRGVSKAQWLEHLRFDSSWYFLFGPRS